MQNSTTNATDDPFTDRLWFRRFDQGLASGPDVLVFPHAGGSASAYLALSAQMSQRARTTIVQYPGRQDRRSEPHFASLGDLADGVYRAMGSPTHRSLILFGHSMGALVALEVAHRLQGAGREPAALVVSAHEAPEGRAVQRRRSLDDASLLAELRLLAGTDARVFDDEEVVAMVMPTVRGDYHALAGYGGPPPVRLSCPLRALSGATDPKVDPERVARWGEFTNGAFDVQVLPGGHFYLDDHLDHVARFTVGDEAGTPAPPAP